MKSKLKFKSFKARLTFWFLVVALLPLLAGSVITSVQRVRAIKEDAFLKLSAIRDLKVVEVNNWLDERLSDVSVMSTDDKIMAMGEILFSRKEQTKDDARVLRNAVGILDRYVKGYEVYPELSLLNPLTGIVEYSTKSSNLGINKSGAAEFTEPMRTGGSFIGEIFNSKAIHTPILSFSIPIYAEKESRGFVGVLVAKVDLEHSLYKLLLNRTGMGDTGETLIVNKDGVALSELRWRSNAPLRVKIDAQPALMAAQGNTGIVVTGDYRGEEVLAAYTFIPRTNWGFVAKQDVEEVYAPIRAMYLNILLVFLISAALVYALAFLVAKNFAGTVLEMSSVSARMQGGDLSARNPVNSADELGFLAESFNRLADSIQSQLTIQKGVADLNEAMVAARDPEDFGREFLKELNDPRL